MSGLNHLCANDVSDDDCNKCMVHGIIFRCPHFCQDFEDIRGSMSAAMLAERERLMEIMGVEDGDFSKWGIRE